MERVASRLLYAADSNDSRVAFHLRARCHALRGKFGRNLGAKLLFWSRNLVGAGEEDN